MAMSYHSHHHTKYDIDEIVFMPILCPHFYIVTYESVPDVKE